MPEMQTPKLVILGSSSGSGSAQRSPSAYLLDLGERGVLIDCGDGAATRFLAAGYEPDWVSDIFISHTHADHVGGLSYFVQLRYQTETRSSLTIHCPSEAIEPLQAIFSFGYLFPERLPFAVQYNALAAGGSCASADFTVTPYPTSHLAPHARVAAEHGYPNRGECFAFHIAVAGRTILYSADIGALSDLDQVPRPIDWLLVETTHIDTDELWAWAAARDIKRIILTHIADDFDPGVVAAAPKYTTAGIVIAEDGMILPIV